VYRDSYITLGICQTFAMTWQWSAAPARLSCVSSLIQDGSTDGHGPYVARSYQRLVVVICVSLASPVLLAYSISSCMLACLLARCFAVSYLLVVYFLKVFRTLYDMWRLAFGSAESAVGQADVIHQSLLCSSLLGPITPGPIRMAWRDFLYPQGLRKPAVFTVRRVGVADHGAVADEDSIAAIIQVCSRVVEGIQSALHFFCIIHE
jgi:hypothetical protein